MLARARRLMGTYLCGCIPFTNVLVFAIQLLGIGYVSWNFDRHFGAKPFLTTMITNSILNGMADTVAQTVSAARRRTAPRPRASSNKKDGVSIEIHDLGEKSLPIHRKEFLAAPPFDTERLVRYMAWGFLMAPIQLAWFSYLSDAFPIGEHNKTLAVVWRVLFDQLIFSPIGLALFFVFMAVAEGGGSKAVRKKFDGVFASALKSGYVLWPAVQIINFWLVPLHFQLPFASTIGICWTAYLSLKNEAAEAAALQSIQCV